MCDEIDTRAAARCLRESEMETVNNLPNDAPLALEAVGATKLKAQDAVIDHTQKRLGLPVHAEEPRKVPDLPAGWDRRWGEE